MEKVTLIPGPREMGGNWMYRNGCHGKKKTTISTLKMMATVAISWEMLQISFVLGKIIDGPFGYEKQGLGQRRNIEVKSKLNSPAESNKLGVFLR